MAGILEGLQLRLADKNGDGEAFTVELYFHGDYRSNTPIHDQTLDHYNNVLECQSVEIALTAVYENGVAGVKVGDRRQSVRLYPLTGLKEIVIWEGGKP